MYAINGNSVIDLYHTDIEGSAADLYVGGGGGEGDRYKKCDHAKKILMYHCPDNGLVF